MAYFSAAVATRSLGVCIRTYTAASAATMLNIIRYKHCEYILTVLYVRIFPELEREKRVEFQCHTDVLRF